MDFVLSVLSNEDSCGLTNILKESPYPYLLVLGKRNVGKTNLIKCLIKQLYDKQCITNLLAISGNPDDYRDITDMTYTKYDNSMYAQLKDGTCIILDDMFNSQEKFVQDLFTYRKRHKFICIITCPYLLDINPKMRKQFDGIYMFQETNISVIKSMYDSFANSAVSNLETFKMLITDLQKWNSKAKSDEITRRRALLLHDTHVFLIDIPRIVITDLIPSFILKHTDQEPPVFKQASPLIAQIKLVIQGNCEIIKQLSLIEYSDKVALYRIISEYNYKLSNLLMELESN